ncbi:MAG: hypothetical protein KGP28_09655 [Bdellovibrionales bacterium]|nr:hypothetical protein [Bdellovibrionales bacterium]
MQLHQHRWGFVFVFLFVSGIIGIGCFSMEEALAQAVGATTIPIKRKSKASRRKSSAKTPNASGVGGEVSAQVETAKPDTPTSRFGFSYWSMFTGPAIGQSMGQSTTSSGEASETGSNYFQILFANYNLRTDQVLGVQLRASTDMNRPTGAPVMDILNPRIYFHQKNVINNSWMSMGLQPFVEIPTTEVSRQNSLRTTLLFAQNFTFKIPDERWLFLLTTMVNQHIYGNAVSGARTTDFIAFPTVGYQLSKTFQLLGWAWFDWTRRRDTVSDSGLLTAPAGFDSWGDNYARVGMNISILENVQFMPCAQVFLDSLRANNTTFGFELSASL